MDRILSLRRPNRRARIARVILEQHDVSRRAARGALLRVAFAFVCTWLLLRDLNARSLQSGYRPYSPQAIQALALSFVAKPVAEGTDNVDFRTLRSYTDPLTLIVYWSLEDEASGLALRDMGWLHDEFESRGLRIIAVSVDSPDRYSDLAAETSYRNFRFHVLQDSPGHARLMRRASQLPIVLLVAADGSVKETTTGVSETLRRSYWGMPAAHTRLQELLNSADLKKRS